MTAREKGSDVTGESSHPAEQADDKSDAAISNRRMGTLEAVRYLWVYSRPYTKRYRTRLAYALACIAAAELIAKLAHLPGWCKVVFVVGFLIYYIWIFLVIYVAGEVAWDNREKSERLEKLLMSHDLEQRFSALAIRLQSRDAEELARLREAMSFGATEARRLAKEIEEYKSSPSAGAQEGQKPELREGAASVRRILIIVVVTATLGFVAACALTHGAVQTTLLAAAAIVPVSALVISAVRHSFSTESDSA
jgi:hypothetical protein